LDGHEILVKEGDHIKKGDKLLFKRTCRPVLNVQAQSATINSAESSVWQAESPLQGSPVGSRCHSKRIWKSEDGF